MPEYQAQMAHRQEIVLIYVILTDKIFCGWENTIYVQADKVPQ